MNETGLVHDTTELRKLIAENPELPIVVLAGEESWWDQGYAWYFCLKLRNTVVIRRKYQRQLSRKSLKSISPIGKSYSDLR